MRLLSFLLTALALVTFVACTPKTKDTTGGTSGKATTTKYKYQTVEGDPLGMKLYTLKNGLRVYMSVNKDEPRIQTMIAVRTGSRNDPADATGLAHYLEHMLFKGTSKMASLDWEKEKVLLQKISDLYEKHRTAKPEERAAIYAEIDKVSSEAAKFVAANEYDKLVASLGAKGTNAFTSFDRTVYINDIPSNEMEKWLRIESERFQELVLRLFHTELEAVYEEFNINQNRDGRRLNQAFLNGLLPNHPYGTQTTIGTGEHLKTPSMVKIHEYFDNYYVPNNMAIVLSGDFDPDEVVMNIEKHFGDYKTKEVVQKEVAAPKPVDKQVVKEILGKEAALIDMGWILPGAGSKEAMMSDLLSEILSNGRAGLVDINLLQKQKVGPGSGAFGWTLKDCGFFGLYALPRPGQKLEEAKDLLLGQLDLVKEGKFDDWMIEAVVNDMEYRQIKQAESNNGRAFKMLDAFIFDIEWSEKTSYYDRMRKITKQDLVDFAKKSFTNNSGVIVYKREGEPEIFEVDKPKITPVPVDRDAKSTFKAEFEKLQTPRLKPLFLDYAQAVQTKELNNGVQLNYLKNEANKTFELDYILEMGAENDKVLPIAIKYLPYLGTDKYSPEDLQKEFYKLGVSFDVFASADVCYVTLSGLERSVEKGMELFEHILANVKPDKEALANLIGDVEKQRNDAKKNKQQILYGGLMNYGRYGHKSPFKSRISLEELKALKAEDLVKQIKSLTSYEHKVFYYGTKSKDEVAAVINKLHKTPSSLTKCPKRGDFVEQDTKEDKVVFIHFEGMAQAEVLMMSKGTQGFSEEENMWSRVYNEYFGGGLSSIVFQEIRESKALAYSAWASNGSPSRKDGAHYYRAFVGTQVDKLKEAIPALREIIDNLPMAEDQLMNANNAILKKIESERITKDNIYWRYRGAAKQGHGKDLRKDIYNKFKTMSKEDVIAGVKKFHESTVKGRKYTFLVLADKEKADMEYIKSLGKFEELSIEDAFGY
ncbi:MAG: insulinase family protein [Aureispira sp.]|nr:insulinase family protein [Aureispira sp.]